MNYIFKNISYEQCDSFSNPAIIAELRIIPTNTAEWRKAHQILNARTLKELQELESMFNSRPALPSIKNVYFNDPVTVVLWNDGTKTIVKCQDGDTYSKETGLALCMAKKAMGNNGKFNDIFKKWIPEEKIKTKSCSNCKHLNRAWDVGDNTCYECAVRGDRPYWKPVK